MRQHFLKILFSAGLIFTTVSTIVAPTTANAAEYHHRYRAQGHYLHRHLHRRHMKTAKRVGIGAAGGAVAGALIGGGKGAAIGAAAGAGAGYLYDRHKKHQGSY
jgi:uncharacterized protein YcfJ